MTGPFPTHEAFAGHVGETFQVSRAAGPALPMTLAGVRTWGSPAEAGARQPFALDWFGPLAPVLPQAIYHFRHEALDPLDFFIVPLGPAPGAMRYEAIFA